MQRLATAAGALAAALPWVIYDVYRPGSFDLTVKGDDVTYEFRDLVYADEFAILNKRWIDY